MVLSRWLSTESVRRIEPDRKHRFKGLTATFLMLDNVCKRSSWLRIQLTSGIVGSMKLWMRWVLLKNPCCMLRRNFQTSPIKCLLKTRKRRPNVRVCSNLMVKWQVSQQTYSKPKCRVQLTRTYYKTSRLHYFYISRRPNNAYRVMSRDVRSLLPRRLPLNRYFGSTGLIRTRSLADYRRS